MLRGSVKSICSCVSACMVSCLWLCDESWLAAFRRLSSQPISWLLTEETKLYTTTASNTGTSTFVFGSGVYPHMPILRPHATRFHERRMHVFGNQRAIVVNVVEVVARWPIRPILGFWGSKVHRMVDSLPWTPMNLRAKFDAASFILGGEIRNRTNKQTNEQQIQ